MAFKGIRLPIPSAMSEYNFAIDEFKGIDKASGADNFSPHRAISAKNFIRDKVGQIKKRGGFVHKEESTSKLSWMHQWDKYSICFYENCIEICNNKDQQCVMYTGVLAAFCFLAGDGCYLLYKSDPFYPTYTIKKVEGESITFNKTEIWSNGNALEIPIPAPVIVEGASPQGGGSLMQSPNLLSPLVTETFTVTENDLSSGKCKRFQLSSRNIVMLNSKTVNNTVNNTVLKSDTWMEKGPSKDPWWSQETGKSRKLTDTGAAIANDSIKIEVYTKITTEDSNDSDDIDDSTEEYEWQTVTPFAGDKSDFVNTELGALWIPSANIGVSPVEGEPNVRITYIRNYNEYIAGLEKLFACTQSACFGVGGYKDRVFLAGGNRIYYSGMDDPLYFGELCYIEPCSADKEIKAMGAQGQYLYAVDSDGVTHVIGGAVTEDDANTYLSDAAFVIADRVQGEKPTIHSALKIFGEEFCYVSEEGVVAIRHDSFYDKRYAQNRSRLLGTEIKDRIEDATVWGNFLVLATETELYLLDELQQTTLPDYKYSGKQYEVYPFTFAETGFEIQKVWTDAEDKLYLSIKKSDNSIVVLEYNEEAVKDNLGNGSITAEWITPPLYLGSPRTRKLIKHLHLSVGAEGDAVKVEYRIDNHTKWDEESQKKIEDWKVLRKADGRFIPFDYGTLDYGCFNYGSFISKLQLILKRRPARCFRKIQFRFTSTGDHPLSLADFGFTYEKEVI